MTRVGVSLLRQSVANWPLSAGRSHPCSSMARGEMWRRWLGPAPPPLQQPRGAFANGIAIQWARRTIRRNDACIGKALP
jgi:hypothetical protein